MGTQTGGYLSAAEHSEFKLYAESLNISVSSLASLLVLREMSGCRIADLMACFDMSPPSGKRNRVTVHHRDSSQKAGFEAHCHEAGVAPDRAAAVLFRAELKERWLSSCVVD